MAALKGGGRAGPGVAIFPWGEVIEEFLDPLGLDLNDFVSKMTGGWLFGYALALQRQGWQPIIVCTSDKVDVLTRLEHSGTGAPVWVAPAWAAPLSAGSSEIVTRFAASIASSAMPQIGQSPGCDALTSLCIGHT